MTDRPGMFTWPGDLRSGMVSDRLSCAVKPFGGPGGHAQRAVAERDGRGRVDVGLAQHDIVAADHAVGVEGEGPVMPCGGGCACGGSGRGGGPACGVRARGQRAARENQAGRGGESRGGERGESPDAGEPGPGMSGLW